MKFTLIVSNNWSTGGYKSKWLSLTMLFSFEDTYTVLIFFVLYFCVTLEENQ